MKRIGLIGGLGPESTIDYYKILIERYHEQNPGDRFMNPEIIIYSVTMGTMLQLFDEKRFDEAVVYISDCLNKLKIAGADFAAITSNTPHLLFERYKEKTDLPLISIVEACADEAVKRGLKRCGLFGTGFTMRSDFYAAQFLKRGITIYVPGDPEIEMINRKLFSELEMGIFREETRAQFLEIVENMKNRDHIDSLILGCTELPLMFREESCLGIPFLSTTRIHIDAIVRECMK